MVRAIMTQLGLLLNDFFINYLRIINRGCGNYGKLGHNTSEDELAPSKVEALDGEMIVDVLCGRFHTCAVTSTGSIYTWGEAIATGHHIKPGSVSPMRLLGDLSSRGVICVSAHDSLTACITKAGEVFTWGNGGYGRLGHGDETTQMTPKRVEALVGVMSKQVACGRHHTAVCSVDGQVFTFGNGQYGQLGHGNREQKTSPVLVQAFEGYDITQVQCGDDYSMALTSSGYVFTWGCAYYVCIGPGNYAFFSIPCLVEGLREHNVVRITTYYRHIAVLVDPSPSTIRQSQQASFNNKEHYDVVIMVENEALYANVNVLSQKSDYFAAMFRSNMRESIERVVVVPDCSKASFLRVLEYLCLDSVSISCSGAMAVGRYVSIRRDRARLHLCVGKGFV